MKELVAKYLGEQEANKRPALTVDGVEFTDDGLRKLLVSESFHREVVLISNFENRRVTLVPQNILQG